jgi:U3 small nucleolar RNA-associated protein 5
MHVVYDVQQLPREPDACAAAPVLFNSPGTTLLVARGSSVRPVFTRLQVSADGDSSTLITLDPTPDGSLFKGQQAAADTPAAKDKSKAGKKQAAAVAAVLGADNAGDLVKQRAAAMAVDSTSAVGRKRAEPEPDTMPAAGAAVGGADSDDEDEAFEGQEEATLGQRVAALEQRQQQSGAGPSGGAAGGAAAAEGAAEGDDTMIDAAGAAAAPLGSGPIKADSLGVLLQQALRSGDKALLERCLGVSNDRVINNSVRRLVPADAALLLREAVARLQSKPARGQQLAGWVRAVLVHHTAYLMAAPGVQPVMTSLYQVGQRGNDTQHLLGLGSFCTSISPGMQICDDGFGSAFNNLNELKRVCGRSVVFLAAVAGIN